METVLMLGWTGKGWALVPRVDAVLIDPGDFDAFCKEFAGKCEELGGFPVLTEKMLLLSIDANGDPVGVFTLRNEAYGLPPASGGSC